MNEKNDQSHPSVDCSLRSTRTGWMQHGVQYRDRALRENADTRRDGDRGRATSLVTVQLDAPHLRKGAGGGPGVSDVPVRAGPHCRNLFHGYRKHADCGRYQGERSEGTRYHLITIYLSCLLFI